MIKGVPGRKQDLPGTTIRKNMKKIEEKVQKIKENKENLRKCSYLAHPGVRQATDSETSLMPVSSVSHVSDRMELHNNSNWASNDLLHTARLVQFSSVLLFPYQDKNTIYIKKLNTN